MAEVLLGAILGAVASQAKSVATEQINLAWGFKNELKRLGDSLEMVEAFLQDAEENQTKKHAVKIWLLRLKDVADEAADVLDEFDHEILLRKVEIRSQFRRKVLDFISSNNPILFRLKMANKLKDILKSLDDLNKEANQYGLHLRTINPITPDGGPAVETDSVLPRSNIVGRKNDVSKIVDLLVSPKDTEPLSVVPIVGVGGLGKTTLAKMVYNDLNVENHFDLNFWVCVSHHLDVNKILGAMFEKFHDYSSTSVPKSKDEKIHKLKEKFKQAKGEKEQIKYLLVLDDVWNAEKWDELKERLETINENGRNGVIVTTRNEGVASAVQALSDQWHKPERLGDDECWSIIKQLALTPSPMSDRLEPIGKEIAKQCQGVPLLAKVIGWTMNKARSRDAWLEIQESGVWGSPERALKVESVLKLSFDHLSSPSLKKCFAYCAMFPKDYLFQKGELIQLWTAEGFLGSSMAVVNSGDKYLNELLSNSLFQDVEKDTCGNILTFKMHDMVHDLALSVSKFDTLIFQENSTSTPNECSHIRHLNVVGCNGESLPESLTAVVPKVYSLFTEIDVFKKLSNSFTRLRVLKFVGATNICELPDSLGELKYLRYLDVSRTSIKALPKSATKFYLLQTLRLLGLLRFTLPDGLENLISLKHLYFDRKELQPDNIGNLTCLQTLPIFFVGSEQGRSITELGSLNELRGELKICHLGGVRDKQEASGANLGLKAKLCKLMFDFEGGHIGSDGCNSEEVMEGLQPHSNLQSLIVSHYEGRSFPSWMLRPVGESNTGLLLLNNLMELKFSHCINCESLPPLGQLHNLQFLVLINLEKVKRMGNEFYCNEGIDGMNEVFPALKKFTLGKMKSLEEWTAMAATKTIMFPCLEELELRSCANLTSIPDLKGFSSLRNLSIGGCDQLEVLPLTGGCSSLEKLQIFFCKKLSKIGDELSTSTCLKELELRDCSNLTSIPDLKGFSSLRNLRILNCNKLEVLPLTGGCSSLEKLQIDGCAKLSKIGDGLSTSTCLKELELKFCSNLTSIPDLKGFSSVRNLRILACKKLEVLLLTGGCSSLEKLRIGSCEKLSKIGDGLSTSTCLKELELNDCSNLTSIPDLKGFSSLRNLRIIACNKLEVLPLTGGCSSLEKLQIDYCTKLSKIGDGLSTSTCLKELDLKDCSNLTSIPDLKGFSSLRNLRIVVCNKLEVLPLTGGCSSLEKFSIIGCEKLSKIGDGLSTSTCLKELELICCSNLTSIPDLKGFSSLRNLIISGCNELEVLPLTGRCSSLEMLVIDGCAKLIKIGDGLSTSTCLKELKLVHCSNLTSIPDLKGFSSLRNLVIGGCDKLESLTLKVPLSSLEKLRIYGCPNLKPIPSLDGLSSLTELELIKVGEGWSCLLPNMLRSNTSLCSPSIFNLPDLIRIPDGSLGRLNWLRELAIGGFSEELQEFPWPSSIQYLSASLRVLTLVGWEKLKSLPHQLQLLSTLEDLRIEEFQGIEAFPEWLGNLSSLKYLRLSGFRKLKSLPHQLQLPTALERLTFCEFDEIEALPDSLGNLSSLKRLSICSCKKLLYLPSVDVMRSLSKLGRIDIDECPQLKTRCERDSGPEWSKISHIPAVLINRGRIWVWRRVYQFENQMCGHKNLRIEKFQGIEAFPEWLGNLSSLKYLGICSCKKLLYLPSVDVMRSLSKLERIDIYMCPQLETRCKRDSGPEWSKISHIPTGYINWRCRLFLLRRQFFHSHRVQPMEMNQVMSDRDSEDEVDDDIADLEDRRMLDDFVDVSKDEKQLMHLWNSFVRKQRVLADGHVSWACEAFSKLHGPDLVKSPALFWCWRLFMIKLWNHGLLDAGAMNNCSMILQRCQNEGSEAMKS